MKKCYSVLYN